MRWDLLNIANCFFNLQKSESIFIKSIELNKLYDNVNDLENDFIEVSPLDLEYFCNLFILSFGFYGFILSIFIFKILRKFSIKKIKNFKMKIIDIYRNLIN